MLVNCISIPFIFFSIVVSACAQDPTGPDPTNIQTRFVPSTGEKLFILGQASEQHMEDYLTEVKGDPLPAGFAFYTSLSGSQPGSDMGRYIQFLNKYPNTTLQLAIWTGLREFGTPGYYMDEVNNGEHDSNIIELANACKALDRPIYIRFGYEFDGAHNSYPPDKYIAAYKYFVDLMRDQGVTNVAYVWHSWGVGAFYDTQNYPGLYPELDRTVTQELWYPGDEYVDWVALSVFGIGWGNLNTNSTVQYLIDFAEAHDKPVMLAETAAIKTSNQSNTDWVIPNNQWFQNVFSLMENNASIKAFTYINVDWEDDNPSSTWGDTRIQESPSEVQSYWLSKIQPFLHADDQLFEKIGYE